MRKKLKLAEGRTVPMEDGRDWPAEGATVDVTLYIRRRLRDGDLVEVPDEVSTTEDPPPPPAEDPPPPAEEGETVTGRKGGKAGGKHG